MPEKTNAEILRDLRREAVARGDCNECRCRPAKPECKTCQHCIDKKKERENLYREQGLCACGKRPRRGKKMCRDCAARGSEAQQRQSTWRKEDGLCTNCLSASVPGRRQCAKHLAGAARKQKVWRRAAIARGKCGSCRRRRLFSPSLCRKCLLEMRKQTRLRALAKRRGIPAAEICIPKFLPLSDGSVKKGKTMVADAKQWTAPRETRDFHYHITEVAVMKYRIAAREAGIASMSTTDREIALTIDALVWKAFAESKVQDIVDAEHPSDVTKIAEVAMPKSGVKAYAMLRHVRPNAYPPVRTCGGPGGIAFGVMTFMPINEGQEHFARGRWRVAFRQLEGPLSKILREQEAVDIAQNPAATGKKRVVVTIPPPIQIPIDDTTRNDNTMDASPAKRTSTSHMNGASMDAGAQKRASLAKIAATMGPKLVAVPDVRVSPVKQSNGRRPRRAYSEKYMREMALLVTKGDGIVDRVAKEHDLTPSALARWVKLYGGRYAPKKKPTKEPTVAQTKTKTNPTKGRVYPPNHRSDEATQQRIDFARAQFAIRPYMNIRGKDGVLPLLVTRFGVGLRHTLLNTLREEAIRAAGGNKKPTAVALPNNKPPRTIMRASGLVGIAAELSEALVTEEVAKQAMNDAEIAFEAAEGAYDAAKQRCTELLKKMQAARS